MTDNGAIRNSIRNCLTVFQNDPYLQGAIRYNILTERIDIVKPLWWEKPTATLNDTDFNYLMLYLEGKFLIRDGDDAIANKILATYRASNRLMELGISYLPAAIFYGPSGTGKTELVKYIAHRAGLPFIYVRFSSLVNSLLGGTQSNVGKVFAYAKNSPCVLCFDEIDAIGLKRGDTQDVSEMSRVTISLMQEMDSLPNNVIIIGTTNRFDRLDPALVRRFPISYQVAPLKHQEIVSLVDKFFRYAGYEKDSNIVQSWCSENFDTEHDVPVSEVITKCTGYLVEQIVSEENA